MGIQGGEWKNALRKCATDLQERHCKGEDSALGQSLKGLKDLGSCPDIGDRGSAEECDQEAPHPVHQH